MIDPADLPKKYGGDLEWEYGMPPSLDEAAKNALHGYKEGQWIRGPVRWVKEENGDTKIVARGTINGKERNEVIAVFRDDAEANGN